MKKNESKKILHNSNNKKNNETKTTDIILIGAGIMSATLSMFLKILKPNWNIEIYERLNKPAQESSNALNNAGTGHSAFCELNYTPQKKDGSVDINKAIEINESFEISKQFWAFLVKNNILNNPESFINNVPHISIVWGNKNINFLKNRFQALQNSILFHGMNYSNNYQEIYKWIPLILKGRKTNENIAATRMLTGTDVNFGEITQQLLNILQKSDNFNIHYNQHITHIQKYKNNKWKIIYSDKNDNKKQQQESYANYIFIGAGGASLNLLQTSKIQEMKKYAGFPVGGQFLVTYNKKIINQHSAKVYGMAPINGPPMSVPHIDTRIISGHKIILFGPFATFNSKFLKYGSWLDFFYSLNRYNLTSIFKIGYSNFPLVKYLINQLIMSEKSRFQSLQKFYPQAQIKDWHLINAGQRVQIIKKQNNNQPKLQFGTELVNSRDNTLFALLGASPGASIATSIALQIIHKIFKDQIKNETWSDKIKTIIPSFNHKLNENTILNNEIKQYTCSILKLNIS